jgi:hypothetical protein
MTFDPERRNCNRIYPFNTKIHKSFVHEGSEYVLFRARLIARRGIECHYVRKDLIHAKRN